MKKFLGTIGFVVIGSCLLGADKPASRPETPTVSQASEIDTEIATLTPEEAALDQHMRQFGDDYSAPLTVSEQIEELGLGSAPVILFAQSDYVVSWFEQSVIVRVNGEVIDITQTEDGDKVYWEETLRPQIADGGRAWQKQGDGRRRVPVVASGFITATTGGFVVQISTAHGTLRTELALQIEDGIISSVQPVLAPISLAKCGCRNADGTGSCSDTQCDKSEGCGKGTCVWRASSCV